MPWITAWPEVSRGAAVSGDCMPYAAARKERASAPASVDRLGRRLLTAPTAVIAVGNRPKWTLMEVIDAIALLGYLLGLGRASSAVTSEALSTVGVLDI